MPRQFRISVGGGGEDAGTRGGKMEEMGKVGEMGKHFTPEELRQWQAGLAEASRNNVLCHCRRCDREWMASAAGMPCDCGSTHVECIACWQFPDD